MQNGKSITIGKKAKTDKKSFTTGNRRELSFSCHGGIVCLCAAFSCDDPTCARRAARKNQRKAETKVLMKRGIQERKADAIVMGTPAGRFVSQPVRLEASRF